MNGPRNTKKRLNEMASEHNRLQMLGGKPNWPGVISKGMLLLDKESPFCQPSYVLSNAEMKKRLKKLDEEKNAKPSLLCLPRHLLKDVLKKLSPEDVVVISRTCRTLKQLTDEGVYRGKEVYLHARKINRSQIVDLLKKEIGSLTISMINTSHDNCSNELIPKGTVFSYLTYLKILPISFLSRNQELFYEQVIIACPNLKHLILRGFRTVPIENVLSAMSCKNCLYDLTILNIAGCENIDIYVFSQFLQLCNVLERLDISDINSLDTDSNLNMVLFALPESLRYLNMSGYSHFLEQHLAPMAIRCGQLKYLILANCSSLFLANEGLYNLQSMKSLECVRFDECRLIAYEDLYVILELSAGIREASGPPSPLEKEDLKLPQFERPECYLVQTRDNQAVMYNQRRRVWRDWRMFDLKFDSDPV